MYSLLQYNTLTLYLLIMLQYFLLLNFRLLIFYRKFIEIPTHEDSCKELYLL